MYSVHDHGAMIADRARTGTYKRALEQTVKPGNVVVDIGAGIGPLSVFACRLGARKVYAIEKDEIIDLARQVAKDNGCADRIECIRGYSTEVELPEKADVIVSDIHGVLPIYGKAVEALIDARRRLLAPHGILIPLRDRIWTAVVDLPADDYDPVLVWSDGRWGIDLSAGRRFGVDCPHTTVLKPASLLTEPRCVATLDYLTLESASAGSQLSWRADRDGQANGFGLWFDSDLVEGLTLSTAPEQGPNVFRHRFAPWTQPVVIRSGDQIEAKVGFQLVHDSYVWIWNTRILSAAGELKADFKQSSLNSMFISPQELRKFAPGHRPRLNRMGSGRRIILELMDGSRTHAEIARIVMQQCPEAFRDEDEALKAVTELSGKYSE